SPCSTYKVRVPGAAQHKRSAVVRCRPGTVAHSESGRSRISGAALRYARAAPHPGHQTSHILQQPIADAVDAELAVVDLAMLGAALGLGEDAQRLVLRAD